MRRYGPFLSLGAGVQSTALLLLSAQGRLPELVAAIFADTGNEPQAVYDHLDRIEEEVAKPAGIPIIRVQWGDIRNDAVTGHRWLKVPVFVVQTSPAGVPCKKTTCKRTDEHIHNGQATRQCTKDYKVDPIKRKIKTLMGAKISAAGAVLEPPKGVRAEQWIGISRDEYMRAKDADEWWLRNQFPLLDMDWTRDDCLNYLEEQGWGSTPKSACVICPYHSNRKWREIKEQTPEEFADAVEFDRQLRSGEMRHGFGERAFLHTDRVPLDQADLRSPAAKAAARGGGRTVGARTGAGRLLALHLRRRRDRDQRRGRSMTTPAVPCVLGTDVVAAINDGGSVLDRLARRRSSARIYPTWLAVGSTEPEERCDDATAHPAHLWAPVPGPGGTGNCVCPGTPSPVVTASQANRRPHPDVMASSAPQRTVDQPGG